MSSFRNKKNLLAGRDEYARYYDDLKGVDFSSDQTEVADSRFAYLVNMYRDYKSGQGGCVETIPGFRCERDFGGKVNGIHFGDGNIFAHIEGWLYQIGVINEDGENEIWTDSKDVVQDGYLDDESTSISFHYQDYLYILGGGRYCRIEYEEGRPRLVDISDIAYTPTTWYGVDPAALSDTVADDYGEGTELEQRNLLNPHYKVSYIANGVNANFDLKEPIDYAYSFNDNMSPIPHFSDNFKAYQYGVELPAAYTDTSGVPKIPEGFPNAIAYVYKNKSNGMNGRVVLVNPPPKPDENTWDPDKKKFDYSREEIASGTPDKEKYDWPFAFGKTHPGVEVVVSKEIKTIGGITNPDTAQHKIISNCRIAALYDNHVFLGGNPDFPRHIFYNVIRGDSSGASGITPDATYFGQLNFEIEGISKSPVVAMMSVGDSLMVLKQDSDEEDSLILHTSQEGPSDIMPVIYPSSRGHKSIGAYGPCFNFRDDPIFLSKYGVDALGHVSTKYRRAIKHRSSLIDAKLLNCDLSNASVAEWGGYLLILTEGKIFMADSRQVYSTADNNTEYEWYYLEDIGVYRGQFDEYVYAEFPTAMTKEELLFITDGVELSEAQVVRDENGIERHLIGTVAFESEDDITYLIASNGEKVYYKELDEYDETEATGRKIKYYVEPSGGKTGGIFDPAVTLKVIGEDLFFATKTGILCRFNFDKRDPKTGLIPNEYYDFNGRTIFSGCATKMDNCGIPHLTKSTVKRSTVIKTRTFKYSGMKVKVRTNRSLFNQVARIINGQATFDDLSFKDLTFNFDDKSIFSVNEKEKKWIEKQMFIYTDEFRRPFALHYLAYRYNIAGRYKE